MCNKFYIIVNIFIKDLYYFQIIFPKQHRTNYLFEFELNDNSKDSFIIKKNGNIDNVGVVKDFNDKDTKTLSKSKKGKKNSNLFIKKYHTIKERLKTNCNKVIQNVLKNIEEMKKEIKKLKRRPSTLISEEKSINVKFVSADQKVFFSLSCKSNDKFYIIESLLYDRYPEYIEYENYFLVNGNKLNRNKTLQENHIRDNDTIVLNIYDF